ncbi:hypothetical protein E1267_13370 [Nonomuraea longispora]|uniref:Uncharacterized protein n=1 Tax=Nonomuraea longispora TaxID=1848320 RepID=A0A4R4NES4_9ACTN|nr:hypothetical protein [Nonomuraea longispora]TDC07459.1 hypothetical protein E1267_13370 [Nonomuraea longispora]
MARAGCRATAGAGPRAAKGRTEVTLAIDGLDVGTATMVGGGRLAERGGTSEVGNAAVTGPSYVFPGGSRTGDRLAFSGARLLAGGGEGRSPTRPPPAPRP